MISGSAFQELGAVIDELTDRELTVVDVRTEQGSLANSHRLSAEITVALDCLSELSATEGVSVVQSETDETEAGVTTTFTVEVPVDQGSTEEAAQVNEATGADDMSAAPQSTTDDDAAEESATEPADDVPYYKNYDRLAEVYEEHDTFAEMTEALGVDVTPATVREHMVNHGIHPTASDDTDTAAAEGSDGEDTADVDAEGDGAVTIEADGYGLPERVTMDSLARTVQQSRTLYEAQTALGLDRSTTRDILTDLDLLDLVTSRLAADHTTDLEEVVDRIHAASTA